MDSVEHTSVIERRVLPEKHLKRHLPFVVLVNKDVKEKRMPEQTVYRCEDDGCELRGG